MKEESHLEDMRAALRGERERAARAREHSLENVRSLVEPSTDGAACVETTHASDAAAAPQAPAAAAARGLRRFLRRR